MLLLLLQRLPDNEGARPQHCTQVQAANFSQEAKECMCKPGPNNPWVVCSAQIQQEVKTATDEAFTALKRLTPKEREDLGRKLLELQPVVQRVLDDGARLEAFVGRVKTAVEAGHDVTFGLPAKVRPDGSLGVGNLGDHKPWLRDHNITSPHEQPFLELVQSSQLRSLKQQFSCGKFGSDFYSAINNLLKVSSGAWVLGFAPQQVRSNRWLGLKWPAGSSWLWSALDGSVVMVLLRAGKGVISGQPLMIGCSWWKQSK